jgi:radical SAM superfamily enzyme YgiQ (UPF0313 family)
MSKKIISFVQPNYRVGPVSANAWYLPYTVGCIWAYANQFDSINNCFELGEILFRRDDIEVTAQKIASHDIVAFSTYIWNKNYNYKLAARIKELNPKCLILFGGPEPPVEKPYIFERYPFMDLVIKKEGELTFHTVLENFGGSYDHIPGLLINQDGKIVNTGNSERISDLSKLPSPYLTGVFDRLVQENPDISWAGTLETNRGCPYQCTFCDWGSLTYNKIKKYSLEKIKAELAWFSTHRCGSLYIADANFGIFPDRDNIIVDTVIENVTKHGYPKVFNMTWAKNKKDEVVALARKWIDAGVSSPGFTMSVQSLDDHVLDNIKRQNMDMNKIENMFQLCERAGVPANTELILGLPGETPESWRNNFWRVFDAGNHTGVDVYQAQMLENAEMNLTQRPLFKMQTQWITDFIRNSHEDPIIEGFDVVISTSTLPQEKMLDAMVFNWFIFTTHISGVTTWIARFLRKYLNLSYEEFYTGLHEFLLQDPWIAKEQAQVRQMYQSWIEKGTIGYPTVDGFVLTGETVLYITRLKFCAEDKTEWFVNLVAEYLQRFDLDPELARDLVAFQKLSVLEFKYLKQYPLTQEFSHNISGYIVDDEELHNPVTLDFVYPENESRDLDAFTFLQLIWYGRRRGFSTTRFKKSLSMVTQ